MIRHLAAGLVGTALLAGTASVIPVQQSPAVPADGNPYVAGVITQFDTPSGQMEDGFYYALETGGFIAQGPQFPAATNHQQFFQAPPVGFTLAHITGYTPEVFYTEASTTKAAIIASTQYQALNKKGSTLNDLKQPTTTTLLGSVLRPAAHADTIAFDTKAGGQITGTSLTYSHTVNGPNPFLGGTWNALTGHLKTATYAGAATSSTNTTTFPGAGRVGTLIVSWLAPSTGANNVVWTTDGTSLAFVASTTAYSGVSQTGQPEVNTGSGGATNTTSTCTLTTISANSWMFISDANAAGLDAAGANTNLRGTNNNGEGYGDGGPFAAGSNTLTLTHGSALWATVCFSFAPNIAVAAAALPLTSVSSF